MHTIFRQLFRLSLLTLALSLLSINISCNTSFQGKSKEAKYVFFLIGDGMGLAQASAAEAYLSALEGKIGFHTLTLSTLPVQSFMTTFSADDFVTCSAASGTAFATGTKTLNGRLSIGKEVTDTLPTIAEKAKRAGKKVGIVTSVSLDHATPAVFYAHNESRRNYYDITMELPESGFDFFGGGGFLSMRDENSTNEILKTFEKNGYSYINTKAGFDTIEAGDDRIIAVSPYLDEARSIPYAIDQTGDEITLAAFTRKAIELLDNEKGFFLMVEGGKIDWSCHSNDAGTTIKEIIDFDKVVSAALEFYEKHQDETLILVFADHETGGMSLGTNDMDHALAYGLIDYQKTSIDAFTGVLNEYREAHAGISPDFNEVLPILSEYFGFGKEGMELSEPELEQLKNAFKASMGIENEGGEADMVTTIYGNKDPLAVTASKMLASRAGIGWTTFSHSALPVPVRVIGVGAERFSGYLDNTDLPVITMELMGLQE